MSNEIDDFKEDPVEDINDNDTGDTSAPQEEGENSFLSMSDEEILNQEIPEEATGSVEGEEEGEGRPTDSPKQEDSGSDDEPVNYEEVYNKVFKQSFKANGKDFVIKTPEEAIQLMQMGINYNKKMAALKPNLRSLKLLEANGLLNEEKINFLIDLEKKNPKAISKLIQDGDIDPLDIELGDDIDYTPTRYEVDERKEALSEIIEELKESPSFSRTIETVGEKWDENSRAIINDNPEILRIINSHVESGIFDLINEEVERARTLGQLDGLSDINAYKAIGDAIDARGGFNHLMQAKAPTSNQGNHGNPTVSKRNDNELKNKKRAVSSPRQSSKRTTADDFNPLSMSDEEFTKLVQEQFL